MRLIAIIILCTISSFSICQRQMIGIRSGYNYNMNRMSGTGQWEPGQCFHIGLSFWYQPKKFYAFGLDLLYEKRSHGNINDAILNDENGNIAGGTSYASYFYNYNYLTLPLKNSFILGDRKHGLTGFINLNIAFGFLLNSNMRIEYKEDVSYLGQRNHNTTEDMFKLDLGGQAEIGMAYRFCQPGIKLMLTLGYHYSFFRLDNPKVQDGYEVFHNTIGFQNISAQISIYYVFMGKCFQFPPRALKGVY